MPSTVGTGGCKNQEDTASAHKVPPKAGFNVMGEAMREIRLEQVSGYIKQLRAGCRKTDRDGQRRLFQDA